MPNKTMVALSFGPAGFVDASLSKSAHNLLGSEILKIAAQIRAMVAAGKTVCNLTVGDFNPEYFPIPSVLMEEIHKAFAAGETNYPPSDGMPILRQIQLGLDATTAIGIVNRGASELVDGL